jgi:hypothetical protein
MRTFPRGSTGLSNQHRRRFCPLACYGSSLRVRRFHPRRPAVAPSPLSRQRHTASACRRGQPQGTAACPSMCASWASTGGRLRQRMHARSTVGCLVRASRTDGHTPPHSAHAPEPQLSPAPPGWQPGPPHCEPLMTTKSLTEQTVGSDVTDQ